MSAPPHSAPSVRWAWLPLPLLLVVMIACWAAGSRTSYESPNFLAGLNFIFSTLASLAVVFLMGWGFLVRPAPGMLILGCGVLIWGVGSFVAPSVGKGNSNLVVTIHNLCVWLAAGGHLAGIICLRQPQRAVAAAGWWIGAACTVALGLVWLVTQAVLAGWLPIFFVQGQGGTDVRQSVLGSAISMLVLAAALLRPAKGGVWSAFAYWYALGLLLLAAGLFGVMIQSVTGSLLGWTGRAAQFLGGAYMIVAALASRREAGVLSLSPEAGRGEPPKRYLVAITLVLAATAVRLAFLPSLGMRVAFITFYPAVILAALYGGLGPGLVATVLSGLLVDYFWIEPTGSFFLNDAAGWLAVAVFLMSGTMISWITEVMHRAKSRAAEAEVQARFAAELALANQALRESEERFRAFMDNSPTVAWMKDEQGRHVYLSQAYEKRFGVRFADCRGKTDFELRPREIAEPFWKNDQAVLNSGQTVEVVEEIPGPDGERCFWWNFRFLIRDAAGQRFVGGVGVDITKSKRIEDTLWFLAQCGAVGTGGKFFQEAARYLAQTLGVDFVCIDRLEDDLLAARTLAVFNHGQFEDNVSYTLKDTPCGDVVGKTVCCFPSDVRRLFPKDAVLQEIQAESYLGTTLWSSGGRPIGLIAVIGRQPLRDARLAESILQLVAVRAAGELERQQAEEALLELTQRLTYHVDNSPLAVIEWGSDMRLIRWSGEAERIFGWKAGEVLGKRMEDFRWIYTEDAPKVADVSSGLGDGSSPRRFSANRNYRKDGSVAHCEWYNSSLQDASGKLRSILSLVLDVTERNQAAERLQVSLREKEVMLKEIHHRVKNNLQVISSLVDLQAATLDPALRGQFREVRDRVRSMALVHEKLYQSENLAQVEFSDYARSLLNYLWRAHGSGAVRIQLTLDLQPVSLSVQTAVPCGLILNELAVNTLKHAFAGRTEGTVTVVLRTDAKGRVSLRVRDDGVGLPAGLDYRQSRSLGLRLVQMLTGQVHGTVEVTTGAGTEFVISFVPLEKEIEATATHD